MHKPGVVPGFPTKLAPNGEMAHGWWGPAPQERLEQPLRDRDGQDQFQTTTSPTGEWCPYSPMVWKKEKQGTKEREERGKREKGRRGRKRGRGR